MVTDQLGFGTEFEAEVGAVSLSRQESAVATQTGAGLYTIKALHLENFKGFTSFAVQFSRFNVLVGGNNSGKSTLLRAVRLVYELTKLHFNKHKDSHADFYSGRSVPKSLLPVAQLRSSAKAMNATT